jgi:hypothetical protein
MRRNNSVGGVQQHAHLAASIRNGQIRFAIAVQVTNGNRHGTVPCTEAGWFFKRAVAVSEQHARISAALVRDRQIQLPVAVQVADGDRRRLCASGIGRSATKASLPGAEQNADVAVVVRNSEVEPAISVEVADRDGCGIDAGGNADGVREGTVAVVQKDANRSAGNDQIGLAISIQIANRNDPALAEQL